MVKSFKLVFSLVFILLFIGCDSHNKVQKDGISTKEISRLKLLNEQLKTQLINKQLLQTNKKIKPKVVKKYIFPNDKKFTFNAIDVSLIKVLYLIANDASMNIIIGNDVDKNLKTTLNLKDIPLGDALDIITKNAELFYYIENNVLYINDHISKKFDISFLNTVSDFNAELGGDVLGGSSNSGASGTLKSEFNINYGKSNNQLNKFDDLKNTLNTLISDEGSYSINISSSILIVDDKYKNINKVTQLLEDMKTKLSKQVLIEAKVLEVILSDDYHMGIDWQKVASLSSANSPVTFTQTLGTFAESTFANIAYDSTLTGGSLKATLELLQEYGSIDTLSNPRIRVVNGQSAIISSGTIEPFWEKKITQVSSLSSTGATITTPETTYTRRDVLDGISMGVTPYIKDDNKIILNVVPVSTTIEDTKTNSGNDLTAPILNVKEAGTIIEVNDGDTVIIGGLLSEKVSQTDTMVPGLGEVPVAGVLFNKTQQSIQKRELVIFIKISLINGDNNIDEVEHNIHIQATKEANGIVEENTKIDKYVIQAGAYSKYPKQSFLDSLALINSKYKINEITSNGKILYSLNIGEYSVKDDARKDLEKIKRLVSDAYILKKVVQ